MDNINSLLYCLDSAGKFSVLNIVIINEEIKEISVNGTINLSSYYS